MRTGRWKSIVALGCLMTLVLAPAPVWAQERAGIAGSVEDETSLALPGVTVVVASPALIEQTRTAVTDSAGNYQFSALPGGTYSVTFTLPGFSTTVREGIVLTGAFVASVDAALVVDALEETVTVTGATPEVDVVSTRQQSVITVEKLHVLPGLSNVLSGNQYVPGVVNAAACCNRNGVIHGSDNNDSQPYLDGVKSGKNLSARNTFNGGIGASSSEAAIQELTYDTSSQSAEFAHSGVRANLIPKAGGNQFAGEFYARGTQETFQSDNRTPELIDLGFAFAPQAWRWDVNPALGGPIKEDKLWFFTTGNYGQNKSYILGKFWGDNDPTRPEGIGDDQRVFRDGSSAQQQVRITHQLTPRNKLTHYYVTHQQYYNRGGGNRNVTSEALFWGNNNPAHLYTARWTGTQTNRLLFQVTGSIERLSQNIGPHEDLVDRVSFQDLATGVGSNATTTRFNRAGYRREVGVSVSYVTGSHNFKAGLNYRNNHQVRRDPNPGDIFRADFLNGEPFRVRVQSNGDFQTPLSQDCDCGFYAQDAWTMDRLTLNLGLRFDWFRNSIPAGDRPEGNFAPALPFGGLEGVPSWNDWSPRAGMAYDLLGDGTTALKASAGRYVANEALGVIGPYSPLGRQIDVRPWTDLNGDGNVINGDLTPQYDEIGPSDNPNFGRPTIARQWDPTTERGKNWEYSAGVERQLGDGWSISGMWHKRRYYNFRWTDNQLVSASDYVPIPFTAPLDPRLPNGGGEQITIYGLAPGFRFSSGDLLDTQAAENWRTWNGFELIVDGQLPHGGFMTASWTAGKAVSDMCQAGRDDPNALRFCHTESPYRHSGKISGALPLPWDTMISGLFQVVQGSDVSANYRVGAGDVGQGVLLRNGSPYTVGIDLIEPNTLFYNPTTSLLLRFSKVITFADIRTRVYMDASNIFNGSAIKTSNEAFGGNGVVSAIYLRPRAVQAGRLLTFGMQMFF